MKYEDLKYDVYNALADVAYELDCKGIRPTKEEWEEAVDNFMVRFFEYDHDED